MHCFCKGSRSQTQGEERMTDEEQQAFPDGILNQDGMTLRDYFAAKATDDDVKEYQTGRKIKEVPTQTQC